MFVQSQLNNCQRQSPNIKTVEKIRKNEERTIYDIGYYKNIVGRAFDKTKNGIMSIDEFTRYSQLCTITISFGKGWSASYKRVNVYDCPCWIDISLLECFTLLDGYLSQLSDLIPALSSDEEPEPSESELISIQENNQLIEPLLPKLEQTRFG